MPRANWFTYLFTVVDRFTLLPEAIPLSNMTTLTCAQALVAHWIVRFGVPIDMFSDRGSPRRRKRAHQIHVDVVKTTLRDLECLNLSSDVPLDLGGLASNAGLTAEAHLLAEAMPNKLARHVAHTEGWDRPCTNCVSNQRAWAGPWRCHTGVFHCLN